MPRHETDRPYARADRLLHLALGLVGAFGITTGLSSLSEAIETHERLNVESLSYTASEWEIERGEANSNLLGGVLLEGMGILALSYSHISRKQGYATQDLALLT